MTVDKTTDKVFDIKVTGYEAIHAATEEEALEKFDQLMRSGYKVSDLRWKTVETEES